MAWPYVFRRLPTARFIGPALARAGTICVMLAGCAGDHSQPLIQHATLAPRVAALDRTRPGAPPIDAGQALTLASVALLAVQNSPDLRAVRAQKGVAQAQVFQTGLLPDPVFGGSYDVLIGGPGVANAIVASLTTGVRPCGWTGSSWRFDRLPGVLILELGGTQVS